MTTSTVPKVTPPVPVKAPVRGRRTGPFRVPGGTLWPPLALAALAVAAFVGFQMASPPASYPVTAVFAQTPGLFQGAAVDLLGVKVGTVTSVRNVADAVVVGMSVDPSQPIPAKVIASFESPQLLGQPDIELSPGYSGGPRLAAGAVVPESRTTEPVSTDQVLKDLGHTLNALNPGAVGALVSNLAQDLNGEGASLHQLITGAAGTLQLLAAKGDDLGRLDGTLAQLTGSLDTRTAEIQSLISEYDTVSGVVAGHSAQLSGAITQLTNATTDLVGLLTPNLASLEQDVATITTAGRTIDRNIPSVDEALAQSVLLFTGAGRAYDPGYNWLNLNNQLPPGVTSAYVAGLVRDRLAGVCRRILANDSAGLSAQEIATLGSCGNPGSGFFDPIISEVPGILNALTSGQTPTAPTPLSMLQQGMSEIPGTGSSAAGGTAPPSSGSGASPPGSGGSGTGSGGSGTGSGGSGSGGCILLILCQSSTSGSSGSSAQTASYRVPKPTLTAPAARLLPPMPPGADHRVAAPAHVARRHGSRRHHRASVTIAAPPLRRSADRGRS